MSPGNNYQEQLKDPRWKTKRDLILLRDDYTCQYCLDPTAMPLEVHHFYYGQYPWSVPDEWLITLCADCHDSVMKSRGRGKIDGEREMQRLEQRRKLRNDFSDLQLLIEIEDEEIRLASIRLLRELQRCTCKECNANL
jgi:hypothetical protein